MILESEIIILRTHNYSETSLIAKCLSKEYGRLDFMMRGAKKLGAKKFPLTGLFRHLKVNFTKSNKGLHTLKDIELIKSYDDIASNYSQYSATCYLSEFLINNSIENDIHEEVFQSCINTLDAFTKPAVKQAWISHILLNYLETHGLMPSPETLNSNQLKLIETLLFLNSSNVPNLSNKQWDEICSWLKQLCRFNDLYVPEAL